MISLTHRFAPDLSVVIPAYQEAAFITSTLSALAPELARHDLGNVEVIVVVADSPDGTAELAERCRHLFDTFRVIAAGPRAGKGRDVRLGLLAARGRYRLFMDADLATPLDHLRDVAALMRDGVPLGAAERDLWRVHRGLKRRLITWFGNRFVRTVLLPGVADTQCGFKLLRADVCEQVLPRCTLDGWGFDLELLAVARALGYGLTSVHAPGWRDPKAPLAGLAGDPPLRTALQVLADVVRVRLGLWLGRYRIRSADVLGEPVVQ